MRRIHVLKDNHDKQEMALWGVSAAGVVGGIGAKTYKAAKDIGNVDG